MTPELSKKVERAIKLIQLAAPSDGSPVEVAYSGGKDSDVILELTRMAGINYRAIYKNTTIDPPGTIAHAKEKGVEIMKPKKTFLQLVEQKGYPNRCQRFCCSALKEYKILDKVIMGIRKAESTKRKARYNEPTECRFYGSKKEHVEAFYPILDWSDQDVVDFILERQIKIHKLYYREDGTIDAKRRLGCIGCPLASINKRIEQFRQYPGMVKAYIRAGQKYFDKHPGGKGALRYNNNIYDKFYREVFFRTQSEWEDSRISLFPLEDSKILLEKYFNIKF